VTDEELEAIKLPDCKMCEGKAWVRKVSQRWWIVGCECVCKRQCEREFVMDCVEEWIRRCGEA
jgi:hypothetical protein